MGKRVRAKQLITVSGTDYQIQQEVDETSGMVTGVLVYDKAGTGHIHFYYDTETVSSQA